MFIPKDKFADHSIPKLIKGIVVPRPIAWVSSKDISGRLNLAPFSFFTVASIKPLLLVITVGNHPDRPKDTFSNIQATGEYVINMVSSSLAGPMHKSGSPFMSEVSEFEETKLTPLESNLVKVPRVAESPVSMEMKLHEIYTPGSHHMIVGEVVAFHINDDVYTEGDYINATALDAVARMAGDYAYVREFFFPEQD